MMENVPFGNTGLLVSRLGFGAGPIGYLATEQQQVEAVLRFLLDSGVNLIDTAACYRGSEEALGQAIGGRRDECVLVSKCGHASGLATPDWDPRTIRDSIDRSLQRLRTDHVDVMLLHSCDRDVLEKGEALAAVVEAKRAGKVRHCGYSGDNETAAYAASLPDVEVIETSINIADQRNIDVVLPICVERGLGVLAKRPIANAAWRDLDEQPGMYREYAKEYTRRLAAMKVSPGDLGYSGHAEVEWPDIALKFTLAHPGVHTAIIGTTNLDNARVNVKASRGSVLREEAVKKLRDAFAAAEEEDGQPWPAQT